MSKKLWKTCGKAADVLSDVLQKHLDSPELLGDAEREILQYYPLAILALLAHDLASPAGSTVFLSKMHWK